MARFAPGTRTLALGAGFPTMMPMRQADLNADLGEGSSQDAALIALISSANIACGGHAGDPETMRQTIEYCMASGVVIGAHPGYEDRENFGRLPMEMTPQQVKLLVSRQLATFAGIAVRCGARIHHVKPHGALYHQADRDAGWADALVSAVREILGKSMIYAPPGGALAAAAESAGLHACAEGFADRRYRPDGTLVPRSDARAVIEDVPEAVDQALRLLEAGKIRTLCVHGDGITATAMLAVLRRAVEEAGFGICAP